MLIKALMLLLLGVCVLQASPQDLDRSQISLQGEFSFADIIGEAEKQLGVRVKLPLKADEVARMEYNQIITLGQLAEAIVVHFAQDDIPLSWNYDAKELVFERKDVRPAPSAKEAKDPVGKPPAKAPPASSRYPVPTIKSTPEDTTYPTMPTWVQERSVSRKPNDRVSIPDELPTLSQTGLQSSSSYGRGEHSSSSSAPSRQVPPALGRSYADTLPTITRDPGNSATNTSPTITRDPGSFSVKIPNKPAPVIRPEPALDTFEPPASLGQNQPLPMERSPSFQAPSTEPTSPRRGDFAITPYPEGAVAFINDAPSIVPGAAKEGFIEWTTRLRGALREGNRMVLEAEKEELERRLRWLKDHTR